MSRVVSRCVLLGVLAIAPIGSCSSDSGPGEPGFPAGGAGGSLDSGRTVVEIDGTVGVTWDAAVRPDAAPANDAPVRLPDAAPDAPPDADTTDPQACSLVGQNCMGGAQQACYPSGLGGSTCLPAGESPAGSPCTESEECTRGYLCHPTEQLCLPLCETGFDCPGGGTCQPLEGYSNVGSCGL